MTTALVLGSIPAVAVPLRGKVALLSRSGSRPVRSVSANEVIVFFEPGRKSAKFDAPAWSPGVFDIVTRGKEYAPRVLVVPAGSTVSFPNQDPILHNVFSVSGVNRFDLGLYGKSNGKARRFDEPGLVRIFCNVHRDMVAYLWVSKSPYYARPSTDGDYRLEVPLGEGRLVAWHERADLEEKTVVVDTGGLVKDLQLRIIRPRVPQHLNKDGKAYSVSRDGY